MQPDPSLSPPSLLQAPATSDLLSRLVEVLTPEHAEMLCLCTLLLALQGGGGILGESDPSSSPPSIPLALVASNFLSRLVEVLAARHDEVLRPFALILAIGGGGGARGQPVGLEVPRPVGLPAQAVVGPGHQAVHDKGDLVVRLEAAGARGVVLQGHPLAGRSGGGEGHRRVGAAVLRGEVPGDGRIG